MMMSLMSCDSARAMLTICLFAALSCPTSVWGERFAWPRRREQLAGPPRGLGAPGEAAARELVAEEDVLGDRETVDDIELLVHRRDAELDRGFGSRDLDRLAEPRDLALVGAVHAREHLDQRRLARAVLAEDAVHLAGQDLQVDAAQGMHAGERLRDARTSSNADSWSTLITG